MLEVKKSLIVIDMQNDFIDGSLGTNEAVAIVPKVVNYIKNFNGEVFATYDTHQKNYKETLEGALLPVEHCIESTHGWELNEDVYNALQEKDTTYFTKPTFGSLDLMNCKYLENSDLIFIVGLCTDICVISNALLLRAKYPNKIINVVESCCAGVTPEKHNAAIEVMKSCQINII